jgi:hypothetical protein
MLHTTFTNTRFPFHLLNIPRPFIKIPIHSSSQKVSHSQFRSFAQSTISVTHRRTYHLAIQIVTPICAVVFSLVLATVA